MNIEVFDEQDETRIKIFYALSDPTRLATIRLLLQRGPEISHETLCHTFDLSFSTLSYHGKILREAGLTTARKEGREKFITLNRVTFEKFLPGFLETL